MVAPGDPTDVLVLDTNIALDLFVFRDPAIAPLREWLDGTGVSWLATQAMREELARVLGYPQIARRLSAQAQPAQNVLDVFDRCVRLVPDAPKAAYTCKDADDQKFIDLAVQHRAERKTAGLRQNQIGAFPSRPIGLFAARQSLGCGLSARAQAIADPRPKPIVRPGGFRPVIHPK